MKSTGALIVKNTAYNFLGKGLPFIIALISIPVLINYLGTERFGILTITWVFVGYFSLFDLGLGRALIKTIAERLGTDNEDDIAHIFRVVSILLGILGLFAGLLLYLITPYLVYDLLNIPEVFIHESINAFYFLSFAIPFTLLSSSFRGTLEAWQNFGLLNIIQSIIGTLTYLVPLLVVLVEPRLDYVVASLVLVRVIGSGILFKFANNLIVKTNRSDTPKKDLLKELLSFGGWITVSNILDPLLNYLDRFIIGAFLTMSVVAYFTTPYEVVIKLVIIPVALITTLFPVFSNIAVIAPEKLKSLISDSYHFLTAGIFIISFVGILGAEHFLYYWVGEEFAGESTLVLQIFLLGYFVNSIAKIPYTYLQSIGRPEITAKIHLAELPFTILLILLVIEPYGIIGIAIIRFIRLFVDMLLLMYFSHRVTNEIKNPIGSVLIHLSLLTLAVTGAYLTSNLVYISLFILTGIICYLLYFWWYSSENRHRIFLKSVIGRVK
jgi:O-antigen/teichoic acid export membrane protein